MERRTQREFHFIERLIAEEANAAREVKHTLPIMVVVGNPPYSGHSANRSWQITGGKRIPTFRGMRQSLMRTFDEIYIMDLHGNAKKRERVPEDVQQSLGIGPGDENVFDIQQGVAISMMIKLREKEHRS